MTSMRLSAEACAPSSERPVRRAYAAAALVGVGPRAGVTLHVLRQAAACAARRARKVRRLGTTLALAAPQGADAGMAAAAVAEGALLGAYEFLDWKSDPKPTVLDEVIVATSEEARGKVDRAVAVAHATAWARDLVNRPAGAKPPAEIAAEVVRLAAEKGVTCEVWERDRIEAEKLGGLLGVAQGSDQDPRLVRLEYQPEGASVGTVCLVGKGITFDSGGLSIKTAEGMETMKTDMSGAAAVCAAVSVLPTLGCPARVVAYALFTENMSGGRAMKPGDVLRFRNGKTAEVMNTDAEGRLILADGLSLACELDPDVVIDLATLTGACQVALGMRIAGLFASDDALAAALEAASARAGERLWRLPLVDDYRELIDSEVADMKNTGPRQGGAINAAMFLREFVTDGTPWAHLDIAGPARAESDMFEVGKGGTGFGVRTLCAYLADWDAPDPS
jgi:leucyl aminopeptidase